MSNESGAPALAMGRSENPCSRWRLRAVPRAGDVLASRRTARADLYTIGIVAGAPRTTATRYSEAIDTVRDLARGLGVDGWFTCNHTHFARVACFRED